MWAAIALTVVTAAAEPEVRVIAENSQDEAGHFAATFAGALVGAAPAVGLVALGYHLATLSPRVPMGELVSVVGVASMPLTMGLAAFLAHRLAGGRGSLGTALISALSGVLGSFAIGFLVHTFTEDPGRTPRGNLELYGTVYGVAGLAAATCVSVGLQMQHRHRFQVGVMPARGGGVLGVSGFF